MNIPLESAEKVGLALTLGLLIGFEREWANKDAGIRTCALTALIGMLAASVSPAFSIAGFAGVLVLVALVNLRGVREARPIEVTTSAAVILLYVLGVMIGGGEFFLPVVAAIAAALLLSWKTELHRFAGDLHVAEIQGAVWMGVLAFVVYPLLPNRFVDRWQLVNPHSVWLAVVIVAAVGFANYILMRLYSARGLLYSAFLGGLVSSTGTLVELGQALKEVATDANGLWGMGISITLLATLACFLRNLLLLAFFSPAALRSAILPLGMMSVLAGWFAWLRRRRARDGSVPLRLASPVALKQVLEFGLFFLAIQIITTLGHRYFGRDGVYVVSIIGGFFSSASTTAALGQMSAQGTLSPAAAGIATVLGSMAAAAANTPVMNRALKQRALGTVLELYTWAVIAAGGVLLLLVHLKS